MTIAARKQREKEEMRQLILDAARRIFMEKGFAGASMRTIAEAIQYSAGTLYLYFKDKDEIFHALHEEGFVKMLEYMAPLAHVADPFERLKAMGHVYIDFARKNPDYYDLMFIMRAPMKCMEHEKWEEGDRTLGILKSVIRECQAAGRFPGKDVDGLAFTIWAGVHGIAALYVRNRVQAFEGVDPETLVDAGQRNFIEMLERA
ncbi:TetR/AcrR family transcriptional regulator [Flaviaesturariibacter amylovorans]|uniref:TetR/AcrR family transcriptional regulator n=1 Tax=Flaviaesturariibacter amylovorans TaxID=1084520 RepID=A0ABP8HF24_9BACT